MTRLRITIDGMRCDHCAETLRSSLLADPGVDSCEVSLEQRFADVNLAESGDIAEVLGCVTAAGFIVRGFAPQGGVDPDSEAS